MSIGVVPVLQLLAGLTVFVSSVLGFAVSDAVVECTSSIPLEPWKRTLLNLLLVGVYSHTRPPASHLLHCGKSPEHLVL